MSSLDMWGAISGSLGTFDNGAKVLAQVMITLFGQGGVVLLGLIFYYRVFMCFNWTCYVL